MKTKEQLLQEAEELLTKVRSLIGEAESTEQYESMYFDLKPFDIGGGAIFSQQKSIEAGFHGDGAIMVRKSGMYKHKSFFLSNAYNWQIEKDEFGVLCLIPTKKTL